MGPTYDHQLQFSEQRSSATQVFETADKGAPAATSVSGTSSTTPLIGSKLLSALMPVNVVTTGSGGWTTVPGANGALPLSDATFKPQKLLKSLPHTYTNAPDGTLAMKAHYPKGSYTYNHAIQGGFSFYSQGPSDVDLTTAKEATLGYSVMFDKNFQFNKGGKLPGLCERSLYFYLHASHLPIFLF